MFAVGGSSTDSCWNVADLGGTQQHLQLIDRNGRGGAGRQGRERCRRRRAVGRDPAQKRPRLVEERGQQEGTCLPEPQP